MANDNYYVYIYLDPRKPGRFKYDEFEFNFEPFYVGQGTGHRIFRHLSPSQLKKASYKSNKINKIIGIGFNLKDGFIFKIKDGLSRNDSFKLEIKLIKLIGRKDLGLGPLTNLSVGGTGSPKTKIQKDGLSKRMTGKRYGTANKGISHTKQHRISLSLVNRKLNDSQISEIQEKFLVQGMTSVHLASIYNVSPWTIMNAVKNNFIDVEDKFKIRSRFTGGSKIKFTKSQDEDIYEKHYVWGFTLRALAKIYDVSTTAILDSLKRGEELCQTIRS